MWLWFLCPTGLLVCPPTCSSDDGGIPTTTVAFVTLEEPGMGGGGIPSFLLVPKPGPACSPEQTHLQTVQPVTHVGEALLGGDVIHEHHPLRLAKQLSCEAVVPARRVCVRTPHPQPEDPLCAFPPPASPSPPHPRGGL